MNITPEREEAARLFFVEALSCREIADRLGMSENTVRNVVGNTRFRGLIHRKYKGRVKR